MDESDNFTPSVSVNVNALAIGIAYSLWDQLDGDPDLPMTEAGGWRQYADAAVQHIGSPRLWMMYVC